MDKQAYVVGVGVTPFVRPTKGGDFSEMAVDSCRRALQDAKVELPQVCAAVVGYNYGEPTRCCTYI